MFTRTLTEEAWRSGCYDELARRSLSAGVSIQETRDSAVLVAKLMNAVGAGFGFSPNVDAEPAASNVISLAAVRAAR